MVWYWDRCFRWIFFSHTSSW